jgi:hypothetical protein
LAVPAAKVVITAGFWGRYLGVKGALPLERDGVPHTPSSKIIAFWGLLIRNPVLIAPDRQLFGGISQPDLILINHRP